MGLHLAEISRGKLPIPVRVGRTRRQACCFVAPLYICRCCRAPLLIPLLIASRTVPTVARSSPHGKASGSERYRLLHTCPPEGVRVLRARKSHPTVPHFPHSLTCLKGTYPLCAGAAGCCGSCAGS